MSTPAAEVGPSYSVQSDITLEGLTEIWRECRALIQGAMNAGSEMPMESTEDVLDLILKGQYKLLIIRQEQDIVGAIVLSLNAYPNGTGLFIVYMGGKRLLSWASMAIDEIERIAREMGAKRIETVTHSGIVTLLKQRFNFSERSFLTKDLDYG